MAINVYKLHVNFLSLVRLYVILIHDVCPEGAIRLSVTVTVCMPEEIETCEKK